MSDEKIYKEFSSETDGYSYTGGVDFWRELILLCKEAENDTVTLNPSIHLKDGTTVEAVFTVTLESLNIVEKE